ncbi:hypothetical protein PPIS_a2326 [Pseudoalteromonas piscicida]|uniref:Uncharacterized protein n=1 Tax=Pseudoalteromonas piscicida TaxID=43662 RepID=A0ABN5CJV6_PSEO7|nr:hypothetical protein PPIS_a2326 [Pseudoalteromonas piscicida]
MWFFATYILSGCLFIINWKINVLFSYCDFGVKTLRDKELNLGLIGRTSLLIACAQSRLPAKLHTNLSNW